MISLKSEKWNFYFHSHIYYNPITQIDDDAFQWLTNDAEV